MSKIVSIKLFKVLISNAYNILATEYLYFKRVCIDMCVFVFLFWGREI